MNNYDRVMLVGYCLICSALVYTMSKDLIAKQWPKYRFPKLTALCVAPLSVLGMLILSGTFIYLMCRAEKDLVKKIKDAEDV